MSASKPHKPNTGVLYPTKEKWRLAKDGRPFFEGEAQLQCPSCQHQFRLRLAGWQKSNDYGPFQSLAFNTPKDTGAPK